MLRRYAVDPRRVYAAGFSGGATVARVLALSGANLAGIIAAGAPLPPETDRMPERLAWFGSAGRADFNFLDARAIDARLATAGIPHRLEFFDGFHEWTTPDVARIAMGWLELLAMKSGVRPPDEALAARILGDELGRVNQLLSDGRFVDARRTLGSIAESYAGVADVAPVTKQIRELDADERLARARKDEQRADDRHRTQLTAARRVLSRLRADEPPTLPELINELNIASLQKAAQRKAYEGEAARRVLETIFVQTARTIPQELEKEREFALAALSLDVAAAIHSDRPIVWLNLAAVRAMSGSKKGALAALSRAVDAGLRDKELLAKDERLASIRGTAEYARLLEAMTTK